MKEIQFIEMNIQNTLVEISHTPDGVHKHDLIRRLKRLYRKKRLNQREVMKRGK